MNDEETVALIAGGHTFGKAHGAGDPDLVGPEPEGCPVHGMGLGWKNALGTGKGNDTITSGLEGAWTPTPTAVGQQLLRHAVRLRVGARPQPGRRQAVAAEGRRRRRHRARRPRPDVRHAPMMATTDLALLADPEYRKISERFRDNPDQFADAFARAWYKLLHRDMGPVSRFLGPWVPGAAALAGPGARRRPRADRRRRHRRRSRQKILDSGLSVVAARRHRVGVGVDATATPTSGAAPTAPASAWRRRRTGRSTSRPSSATVLSTLERIQQDFGKTVSLADLIVLGGVAAVEKAAKDAGHDVTVPFSPGRTDASQEQTDVESFAVLEPKSPTGSATTSEAGDKLPPETAAARQGQPAVADRAGDDRAGRRPAGARRQRRRLAARRPHRPARHADQRLLRQPARHRHGVDDVGSAEDVYEGERHGRPPPSTSSSARNSQLRAIAEVYASDDAKEKFVRDFVAAWDKVMNLDRFDLDPASVCAQHRMAVLSAHRTGRRQSMTTMTSPEPTDWPGATLISVTVPALSAAMLFSIFIASSTQTG